jgi:hypothetical protein
MPFEWQVIAMCFGALVLKILTGFRSRPDAALEVACSHAQRCEEAVRVECRGELAQD